MDLEGFKPLTLVSGKLTMTVSHAGVSFSQAAVACLDRPEFVRILINYKTKEFVIKVTDAKDNEATRFFKPGRKHPVVRWNNSLLKDTLTSLMNWDIKKFSYRIEGEHMSDEKLILFRLENAKRI